MCFNLKKSQKIGQKLCREGNQESISNLFLTNIEKFKMHFNGRLRVKPLMVACSAEVNAQVLKHTKLAGFDQTVMSPLTEDII